MGGHWHRHAAQWQRIGPPLRPDADVVEMVERCLADVSGRVLLLGVTPELANVAPEVLAVDRSAAMIARVWPGDTVARRAVVGEWSALPVASASVAAAVGDGSLAAVPFASVRAVLDELARVLVPRGRVAIRVFRRPDACESVADVFAAAARRECASFHGFKWRLAMAFAAQARCPDVAVRGLHACFVLHAADREGFARAGGFPRGAVDTIDAYEGSTDVYSFPTGDELVSIVPPAFTDARFVPAGRYELAERCPLLVLERSA